MVGILNSQPKILKSIEFPTPRVRGEIFSQLFKTIDALTGNSRIIDGIGIASPGPLDVNRGLLLKAPNLPGWENLALGPALTKRYKVPVVLENDANAAALAEALWGAGKGYRHVFYATVSTGIGTGLVINKKVYQGRTGMALEGGHSTIDYQGTLCKCGLKGCIEAYASGPSIVRRAKAVIKNLPPSASARDIQNLAESGNKTAVKLIKETADYLAVWLGNMINIFDPDVIVLGGGVSFLGKMLFEPLRKLTPKYSINPRAHEVPIVQAKLQRNSGLLGAAAVYLQSRISGK